MIPYPVLLFSLLFLSIVERGLEHLSVMGGKYA
jgi:hypothetical protein